MQSLYLGNDSQAATAIVQKLYPNEARFDVIDEGQENLIIVVGQLYTVRFPRNEEVWQRGLAERNVLEELSSSSLPVPKLIAISENPAYIQTTYLRGNHLDPDQIRTASKEVQQQISEEMARFAYTIHRALPRRTIEPLLVPPTWSYDDYLKRVLFDRIDPNPKIDELAKRYYQAWLDRKVIKEIIVHDDLHTGNLLFDDDYHLVGVLDFGAVCIGSPEQELRQTYRLGDEVFETAATVYEKLSGKSFNREMAKLWTITQELASYCREDSDEVHRRAFNNLRFWFPEIV